MACAAFCRLGSYEVAVGPNERAQSLWRTLTIRRDGSRRFSRRGSGQASGQESSSHSQSLRHSDSLQARAVAAAGQADAPAKDADQLAQAGVVLSK